MQLSEFYIYYARRYCEQVFNCQRRLLLFFVVQDIGDICFGRWTLEYYLKQCMLYIISTVDEIFILEIHVLLRMFYINYPGWLDVWQLQIYISIEWLNFPITVQIKAQFRVIYLLGYCATYFRGVNVAFFKNSISNIKMHRIGQVSVPHFLWCNDAD